MSAQPKKPDYSKWANGLVGNLYGKNPEAQEVDKIVKDAGEILEKSKIYTDIKGLKEKLVVVYPIGGEKANPFAAAAIVDGIKELIKTYRRKTENIPGAIDKYLKAEECAIKSYNLDIDLATVMKIKELAMNEQKAAYSQANLAEARKEYEEFATNRGVQ